MCWCVRLYPGHRTPRKSPIHVCTYRGQIAVPAAMRGLAITNQCLRCASVFELNINYDVLCYIYNRWICAL